MKESKLRRYLGGYAFLFYAVCVLVFGLSTKINTVYANEEATAQETQQSMLEDYDLSAICLKLFDGQEYYDLNETGVTYSGKPYIVVLTEGPAGLRAECIGDAQTEPGEYNVIIKFYGDGKHNPVPDMLVVLKINKKDPDMSAVELHNSNIPYDDELHYLYPTNLPENVKLVNVEGNGVKGPGAFPIVFHYKYVGEDAKYYNDIPPMTAILNIVSEKDPNKLDYDESNIIVEDKTFIYDGKQHSLEATGIPEGVIVQYTGNKKTKEGTYEVRVHFIGDDTHNVILDRVATMTIIKKDANSSSGSSSNSSSGGSSNIEKPGDTNKPGDVEQPEQPEEPGQPEEPDENHIWTDWYFKNDQEDERKCSHCGITEVQPHQFKKNETEYVDNEDGTHAINENYSCDVCNKAKYTTSVNEEHKYEIIDVIFTDNKNGTHQAKTTYSCRDCSSNYVSEEDKTCEYSEEWIYVGNSKDADYCKDCNNEQIRQHQHSEEPQDLEYVCKSSNNDGTHILEASYVCVTCRDTVIINDNEACTYDTTYRQTGVNDIHIEINTCTVCQYSDEKEGDCVPVGELKTIRYDYQIYDYYDCEKCGDWCKRVYHTIHRFGPWKYRDEKTHIRYCACSEEASGGRQTERHVYTEEENGNLTIYTCEVCDYTKTCDHDNNICDNMDLMEVLKLPQYSNGHFVSKDQIANPNPKPDSWCSRYELFCPKCGDNYYILYSHNFKDGFCTRKGYCGGIAQTSSTFLNVAFDLGQEIKEEAEEDTEVEDEEAEGDTEVEDEEAEGDTEVEDEETEEDTEAEDKKEDCKEK